MDIFRSFENSLPSGNTVTHWEGGEKCRLTYPLLISDELVLDWPDITLEVEGERDAQRWPIENKCPPQSLFV